MGCTDFKLNPQRIVSPIIDSRKEQPIYYFTSDHEQIVCGCFSGTMEEFENYVNSIHDNNQDKQDYMKWIKAIKAYKEEVK